MMHTMGHYVDAVMHGDVSFDPWDPSARQLFIKHVTDRTRLTCDRKKALWESGDVTATQEAKACLSRCALSPVSKCAILL